MREDHRPWPKPSRRWTMAQRWHDVLFMHWAVPPEALRALVPEALELDLHEGRAWLGIVPFRMSGIRLRWLPPVPGTSAFPELNVRTYVTRDGKPGVWFFSLEATNALAVWTARRFFHLPYQNARMSLRDDGETIRYASRRTRRGSPPAEFSGRYRPTGPVYAARPGDLDHWLTERYCLYSLSGAGTLFRGEILHDPWPLQPAAAEIEANTMAPLPLPDEPPLLHFARFLDVRIWSLERV